MIAGRPCINNREIDGSSHVVERKCVGVGKLYIYMPTYESVSLTAVSGQWSVCSSESWKLRVAAGGQVAPDEDQVSTSC